MTDKKLAHGFNVEGSITGRFVNVGTVGHVDHGTVGQADLDRLRATMDSNWENLEKKVLWDDQQRMQPYLSNTEYYHELNTFMLDQYSYMGPDEHEFERKPGPRGTGKLNRRERSKKRKAQRKARR